MGVGKGWGGSGEGAGEEEEEGDKQGEMFFDASYLLLEVATDRTHAEQEILSSGLSSLDTRYSPSLLLPLIVSSHFLLPPFSPP